jgi:very-short-patch-repair endonuclease
MAAVLSGGGGAVLSHRAAAAHWGIRPSQAKRIEVTAPRKLMSRPGLILHCSFLPADEITTHDAIPVTTVSRTLFDLAGVVPRAHLERAVKEAEIRRLWDSLSLADLLARHPRRPGAAAVRSLIDEPDTGITRNDFEAAFTTLVERTTLDRPAKNLMLHIAGRWIEADFVWSEQRLIVELDGRATHQTRAAFENDRARDRALVAAGWRVIRVTWRQLRDEPDAVAADLRAALTRR